MKLLKRLFALFYKPKVEDKIETKIVRNDFNSIRESEQPVTPADWESIINDGREPRYKIYYRNNLEKERAIKL